MFYIFLEFMIYDIFANFLCFSSISLNNYDWYEKICFSSSLSKFCDFLVGFVCVSGLKMMQN